MLPAQRLTLESIGHPIPKHRAGLVIGARYLALEWDIDQRQAVEVLQSVS